MHEAMDGECGTVVVLENRSDIVDDGIADAVEVLTDGIVVEAGEGRSGSYGIAEHVLLRMDIAAKFVKPHVEGAEEALRGRAAGGSERDGVIEVVGVGLDHIEITREEQHLLGGTTDKRLVAGKDYPGSVL